MNRVETKYIKIIEVHKNKLTKKDKYLYASLLLEYAESLENLTDNEILSILFIKKLKYENRPGILITIYNNILNNLLSKKYK